jgi:hypothetical protein
MSSFMDSRLMSHNKGLFQLETTFYDLSGHFHRELATFFHPHFFYQAYT